MKKNRFKVAVLGATGTVGQRVLSLLDGHPALEVVAVAASERSAGKRYADATKWNITAAMPEWLPDMIVKKAEPGIACDLALSAMHASVAGDIELAFAESGTPVITNARNHRMEDDVPLLIPEVNPDTISLIDEQKKNRGWEKGFIVTNPNCSTVGLVTALKPIDEQFGVQKVSVVTLQALSGAGYPGVPSTDILDNVIPYIGGEEEKMQKESIKLLGKDIVLSASCNRVPVRDGHLECVSVQLEKEASQEELVSAWEKFSATEYLHQPDRPQPLRDRDAGAGMTVSVGRLRPCPILGHKFVILSHNTIRGAAGAAIANAELLIGKGVIV